MTRTPTLAAHGARGRGGCIEHLREAVRGPGPRLYGPGMAVHCRTATIATNCRGLLGRLPIHRTCDRGGRPLQACSRCADGIAPSFDRARQPVVVADLTLRRAGW